MRHKLFLEFFSKWTNKRKLKNSNSKQRWKENEKESNSYNQERM